MSNPVTKAIVKTSGCNCQDTSPCNKCNNGQPCNCPPDYSVLPQPSPCICCPNGYTYDKIRGYCISNISVTDILEPIPCPDCEESIATDCITYTGRIPLICGNNVYGINPGDSLNTILSKMCITNQNVLQAMLSAIGLDPVTYSGFCQLSALCPVPIGSTTPLPNAVIITFP